MVYVLDTHVLVWVLEGGEKLGDRGRWILRNDLEPLLIPTIVLAETKHMSTRGRTLLSLREAIEAVRSDLRSQVCPLDVRVVDSMPGGLDIHDAIICGTALLYRDLLQEQVSIITRDEAIRKSGIVETAW